jgi:outer membrane beta-barrel protein
MKSYLIIFSCCFASILFAAEDSIYDFSWLDKDKEVYVLQNRKFRKSGQVYVGGTFGKSVSGAFIDSTEMNAIAGFFFKENWGLELSYTKADGTENKTSESVAAQGSVPFYRKMDTATTAMLMWSPFYSKINTFNKIFYYDWMFGVGTASVATLDNRNEFPGGSAAKEKTKESQNGIAWMTAIRFYMSQSWSFRVDFRAVHVNADSAINGETDTEKRWNHYYNFNLGLNYTF